MRNLWARPPTEVDCDGSNFTFEKGVTKSTGSGGFADVWKRGHFAWEYKAKHKDLNDAYQGLLKYREALENPPLLVVCDFVRFEVHTNWTNTAPEIYKFDLDGLLENRKTDGCKLPPQEVLSALFIDPEKLRPGETPAQVTKKAAAEFASLADSLRGRGVSAEDTAHYIMRLLFCLFAEDIRLLRDRPFRTLIDNNRRHPERFVTKLAALFDKMSHGGSFGADDIPYFDGGLFTDDQTYDLSEEDLDILFRAAKLNWAGIEPAIFGTLFERVLDPNKTELGVGAKYTSVADIELVVKPILMEPLRQQWSDIKQRATELVEKARSHKKLNNAKSFLKTAEELLREFLQRLNTLRILDPACGSGNFLYVALKHLLDLEKEVSTFAWAHGLSGFLTGCHPSQLYGIESNAYAHKVASVSVWIGYLQWHQQSGMPVKDDPLMQPLNTIQHADAILDRTDKNVPKEPSWPAADVIIGNPPFLGGKRMRAELGNEYVDDLFQIYDGRVPHEADFVCYWFEKARQNIGEKKAKRAGLLATQAIRGGANRIVLEKINKSGRIFWAYSDRDWVLEGTNVHVSMIGFDDGSEQHFQLNGNDVATINANLTTATDVTHAHRLKENEGIAYMGTSKIGPFDISVDAATAMLKAPNNPNGRPNSDVVKPWINGEDITGRPRNMWIIDFGPTMTAEEAALYEAPFEYVRANIKSLRQKNNRELYRKFWWIHGESRPGLRQAIQGLSRYIVTPRVSKHRLFAWVPVEVLADSAVIAIARDDDYFFGILQSRVHELWSRAMGTQLREVESGFRYTPTSTFETFPFPQQPNEKVLDSVGGAARALVKKRDLWLNPPGASAVELKNRTLTNLYNENPTWLRNAHDELNDAVLMAYGWGRLSDDEVLSSLLVMNLEHHSQEQEAFLFEMEEPVQPRKKRAVSSRVDKESRDRISVQNVPKK